MKIRTLSVAALAAAMLMPTAPVRVAAQETSPVVGTWTGKLAVGGTGLTMVFHIKSEEGKLSATLDSPDQGATGIPGGEVTFTEGTLLVKVPAVQGEFEGKLSEDGTKITGQWKQSGMALPLEVAKGAPPASRPKPQEPAGPLPYATEDVTFHNASAGHDMAGTLTTPRTAGPHPAVVLISGSGPQDRNEALLGHKPFLVLADHLTRNGIAVLRYDDRGVGGSGGDFATATTADFVTDALAAVAFLEARPGIDAAKIGLIGHSEGGLIAPSAATRSKDVAFIVMMAGPGVPGEEVLLEQIALISRAAGMPEDAVQRGLRSQNRIYEVMHAGGSDTVIHERLVEVMRVAIDSASAAERARIGTTPEQINAYIETQVRQVMSPWFRYFLSFDPRPVLEKVTVPVLALNGALDLQVPPSQNLPEIRAALERGGNKDVTIRELPGLNHLLQTARTGAPTEYGTIAETISPTALDLMSSWINQRFGPGAG